MTLVHSLSLEAKYPIPDIQEWLNKFLVIEPGNHVVLKPNLVKEAHEIKNTHWEYMITHGSVIDEVCRCVCKQLAGNGKVTICDGPQTDSSFAKIADLLDLYGIAKRNAAEYGVPVEVIDLRNEEWVNEDEVIVDRKKLPGDPKGTIAFNLGKASLLYNHPGEGRYYGADYDTETVNRHHRGEIQEYLLCATPIMADVFINLPKLKTHKKAGVTLSLKNLVGINADKNWLPHHTQGTPDTGGDQFPRRTFITSLEQFSTGLARKLALGLPIIGPTITKKFRKAGKAVFGNEQATLRSGNWYGNDTTWRMVLDLNRCLMYGRPDGTLNLMPLKKYFTIIDGIIGMEGNGPMRGDPIATGFLVGGNDPVAVDTVACHLMGYDWRKIPVISEAYNLSNLPLTSSCPEEIREILYRREGDQNIIQVENKKIFSFKAPNGWKGHIEKR